MANLREHIEAELAEMAGSLGLLPPDRTCSGLSSLELAGIAAIIQSFYNGVENILRCIMYARGETIPQGPTSHRDLLASAKDSGIVSEDVMLRLGPYMQFRHFFRHSYTLDIDAEKLEPLLKEVHALFETYKFQVLKDQ